MSKFKPRIWYWDFVEALIDVLKEKDEEIQVNNDSIDSLFKSLKKEFKKYVKENNVDMYEDDI